MDIDIIKKVVISVVVFCVVTLVSHFLKKAAKKIQQKKRMRQARYFAVKRLITFISGLFFLVILIFIWGVNVKDLWISVAGILAMVAVAFFAVWSLVGNILAGFIIFFTSPFKINDTIEILPDEIKGKVLAINTFYSIIVDQDDNYINIPNSLFFQKYIRKFNGKQ